MMTLREELYELIDQLPDEEIERLLVQVRASTQTPSIDDPDWHQRMRELRARLYAKYGKVTDSTTILEEIREERLNDIMGGQ